MFLIGTSTFILISEMLQVGLAHFLTRRRPDKWTKELEYIYLFLGATGIVATINRLEAVTDRIFKLLTALVR